MSPATAAALTQMMVAVVDHGTGTAAQIPGVTVAGKTGTAQNGGADAHLAPHAWFIAFAPANAPRYAVAVIVPNGGSTKLTGPRSTSMPLCCRASGVAPW